MREFWLKYRSLIISLAISLGVGGLATLLTMGAREDYASLIKPAFSPPGWLFPVVWTVLFVLMGISAWIVYESDCTLKIQALALYGLSLVINFLWPIFFFNMGKYLASFFWLIVLWILVFSMIRLFLAVDKRAGLLQIPYLVWLTFAGYLNLGVYLLNR